MFRGMHVNQKNGERTDVGGSGVIFPMYPENIMNISTSCVTQF